MSQGGSRRPYSRGGPRCHPRYKDYWDYDQNYSDGSSAGSPKEALVHSPPPHRNKRDMRPHDHRRNNIGAGGSRRAERRPAHTDYRRTDMRMSPNGAGPSAEPHYSHHHHLETNPLEGPESVPEVAATSLGSDGEISKHGGGSPTRKRRRISRHMAAGDSPVSVPPPAVERRTPRHHYQPPRRVRYVSGVGAGAVPLWPHGDHHAPLLIDINQMSLRGRLGSVGSVGWHHPHPAHPAHPAHPHPVHHPPHPHPAHPAHPPHPAHPTHPAHMGHPHPGHMHHHREHAQRTQVCPTPRRAPLPAHLPHLITQMVGGVVGAPGYQRHYAHHYLHNTQRPDSGEGGLSPLHHELHHPPLLINTEARAPLELVGAHARHALAHTHRRNGGMGVGVGGPVTQVGQVGQVGPVTQLGQVGQVVGQVGHSRHYLRHARWGHLAHIHPQPGGVVAGAMGGAPPLQQLALSPLSLAHHHPPTYQVFLNLLAMFPMSSGEEAASSSEDNYEQLLTLAERLGEAKQRGLPRHLIHQLPTYKYSHTGSQSSCVVCLCEFESRQTLRVLPCSHEYHARCIDKWLRTNRTCPICRGNASEYFNNSE